ncbi:DMT family transporter [Xanthobacter sp. TB0136]|uniref:DMT family transporter n=1 Tax=Xanthobacter sp. TB0136 TaxID=3459177 RepID=UPI00403A5C57
MGAVSINDKPLNGFDYLLYAANILIFGSGWLPMRLQLGTVAPEVSVLWRFLAATIVIFLFLAFRQERFMFRWRDHLLFAGMGATLFSLNFLSFYYAGYYLSSGLTAVVFALAAIVIPALSAVFLKVPVHPRLIMGAVAGIGGIALVFGPALAGADRVPHIGTGLLLSLFGMLCFSCGSLLSGVAARRGLPLLSMTAWGFFYGLIIIGAIVLARGEPLIVEWSPRYLGTLFYLIFIQTLLGFAIYLLLVRRIGTSRAGYGTVLFPLVALAMSTLFEGYQWTLTAGAGVALVLTGALLVLMPRQSGNRTNRTG